MERGGVDGRGVEELSPAQARRLALGAQGLLRRRPDRPPTRRALLAMVQRLGVVQIDSVSAVVRSHYLPAYARLGPYDRADLEDLAWGPLRRRRLVEYWAHEASLLPLDLHPLLRWRMDRAARGVGTYASLARFAAENGPAIEAVLTEVAARGPLSAGDLDREAEPQRRNAGGWWNWGPSKRALEWLFWTGQVTVATRRSFERRYDLPERVLPLAVLDAPTPPEDEAQRALLLVAAQALGIATAADLGDYYRIRPGDTKARVAELVEAGGLEPVAVRGWRHPAYRVPGAVVPRGASARTLLSPFDNLVWERSRTERLFGFRLRLEIYVPEAQRVHGYYVLPFLLGDRLVARVDLRSDRAAGVLRVPAAHAERYADGPAAAEVAAELAAELRTLADWLGLDRVEAGERGDLAPALGAALRGGPSRA